MAPMATQMGKMSSTNGINRTNGIKETNGIKRMNGVDSTNGTNGHTNGTNGMNGMNGTRDIEDSIADLAMKKKKRETLLDKTRGFVKYKRESKMYRDPQQRQQDWEEIFDFKGVRRGLKTQAARSATSSPSSTTWSSRATGRKL